MMSAGDQDKSEIFIEFVVRSGLVKVTAIDAATGTEASIFGLATAPREALSQSAVRKLAYVLKKRMASSEWRNGE